MRRDNIRAAAKGKWNRPGGRTLGDCSSSHVVEERGYFHKVAVVSVENFRIYGIPRNVCKNVPFQ